MATLYRVIVKEHLTPLVLDRDEGDEDHHQQEADHRDHHHQPTVRHQESGTSLSNIKVNEQV